MADDWNTLQEFVTSGSQDAFGRVVSRYVDLVYSAAKRQMRSDASAEDVTQAVFLILARKARELPSGTVLPAWLLRTTRYAANNALRTERRRQRHEMEAGLMRPSTTAPSTDLENQQEWQRIAPLLDSAIDRMRVADRKALALRYFDGHTIRQVGEKMGISESAAKVRLSRAVDRLGAYLREHGVSFAPAVLATQMEVNGVSAAPAHLASAIQSASSGSTPASLIANTTITSMNAIPMKAAAIILLTVALAGVGAITAASTRGSGANQTKAAAAPVVAPATSAPATTQAAAPDPEASPLMTLGAISTALHAGDIEAVRNNMVLGDDVASKILGAILAEQIGRIRLTAALNRAGIKNVNVNNGSVPLEVALDLVGSQLSDEEIRITNDTAILPVRVPKFIIGDDSWENGHLQFTRVDGRWRLNVRDGARVSVLLTVRNPATRQTRQLSGAEASDLALKFMLGLGNAYEQLTQDVTSGRLATTSAVQKAFSQRMQAVSAKFNIIGTAINVAPAPQPY